MVKIVVMTFIFSSTLTVIFLNYLMKDKMLIANRLKKIITSQILQKKMEEDELSKPFSERVIRPILVMTSQVVTRFIPAKSRDKLQQTLQYAGTPGNLNPQEFQTVQYVMTIFLMLAFWLLAILPGRDIFMQVSFALLGGITGTVIIKLYLTMLVRKRQGEIQKELPDILDLLTVSVDAGLGFDAALYRVTEKSHGALSNELRKMLQEVQMGKARRTALKDLGQRTGVDDLLTFIGSMIQADQLGVPISKVIRTQAEQVRLARCQRIEEKAMKAPVKMLIPMVLFIFPSIFIVLLGPAAMKMYNIFFIK
ncbi:MAG: type II secretion system F family protein [Clostridia bacterium]|nr:type II secretion system F family protein [Clostridia bacterium]